MRKVAKNLGVAVSTVSRINSLFFCTGSVEKRSYPSSTRHQKKLSDAVKFLIMHSVVENPELYLRELKNKIFTFTGVDVSPSLICNYLKKNEFL